MYILSKSKKPNSLYIMDLILSLLMKLYHNPFRRGNVHAGHSGEYGVGGFTADTYTKKRIGYHKEYAPLDVPYRSDGDHHNRDGHLMCAPGPSLVELDKHYHEFGPPSDVYTPTGSYMSLGSNGTGQGMLYWPACNWIFPEVLGHEDRASFTKYCPHVIFRKKGDLTCGNPDPQTALGSLGPDELLPSGVPVIGCSTCYVNKGRAGVPVAGLDCCSDKDPYNDPILSKIWGSTDNDYQVVGIQLTGAIKSDGTFIPKHELSVGAGRALLDNFDIEIHDAAEWPDSAANFPNIPEDMLNCEPWMGAAATRIYASHANGDTNQYLWWHGPLPYFINRDHTNTNLNCSNPTMISETPDKFFNWDEISGAGAKAIALSDISYTGIVCHQGKGYFSPGYGGGEEYYMDTAVMAQYVHWGMHWGCGDSSTMKSVTDLGGGLGNKPGGIAAQENAGNPGEPTLGDSRNPHFYEYQDLNNTGTSC